MSVSVIAGEEKNLQKPVLSRPLITVSIMLATVMQALDTTIANVALPSMQGGMSATQDQISWVLTSYIVAAAIFTPLAGVLSARLGRKRVFLASVFGFTLSSMLCGASLSLPQIIVFRLVQGMFGAALVPLSQAILLDTYPPEKHGPAMAIWGLGVMVGPILGPSLGGYLTEYYNWRWVFYINLPIGLLAFLGILTSVPETSIRRDNSFDIAGFALLSVAIGAMQLFFDRGQTLDWWASQEIVTEAVLAILAFYLFLVHMFHAKNPFISPALFKDRNMLIGLLLSFQVGVTLYATLALLPPFMQDVLNVPVITTGFTLAPRGTGTMIAMIIVGKLINKVDVKLLFFIGYTLTALAMHCMSKFNIYTPLHDIIWTGILQGFGFGFIFVPLSTTIFATLPRYLRAEGTAMYSLVRNIGSSIGISIVVTLLARNVQVNHAELAALVHPFRTAMNPNILPQSWNWTTDSGLLALNSEINRQALSISYCNDFTFVMWLTILSIPFVFLFKTIK